MWLLMLLMKNSEGDSKCFCTTFEQCPRIYCVETPGFGTGENVIME